MVDATAINNKDLLHAVFPALVVGLFGIFIFDLFAVVYSGAGGVGIFASTSFMSAFGFFVGFAGKLGITFEKYIV